MNKNVFIFLFLLIEKLFKIFLNKEKNNFFTKIYSIILFQTIPAILETI